MRLCTTVPEPDVGVARPAAGAGDREVAQCDVVRAVHADDRLVQWVHDRRSLDHGLQVSLRVERQTCLVGPENDLLHVDTAADLDHRSAGRNVEGALESW
jgi:hypothetical protein